MWLGDFPFKYKPVGGFYKFPSEYTIIAEYISICQKTYEAINLRKKERKTLKGVIKNQHVWERFVFSMVSQLVSQLDLSIIKKYV